MMRGFETYNKFKKNIKDSRQIYDITFHLYQVEKLRLQEELKTGLKVNPVLRTSVSIIEHSPFALHERLSSLYPFKLRQLLLISSITALEVYLTDVILEVFERDISPFKVNEPVTYQKNHILSLGSIGKIQRDIITKDIRNLTSGGQKEIYKYYKKMFSIDFKNLGLSYKDIEEIHERRHLFIHRNGVADSKYVSSFPQMGYRIAQHIKVEHEYFITTLNKLSEFAALINKELLNKYPEVNRQPKYIIGTKRFEQEATNLMIDISILSESFDHIKYLTDLEVRGKKLSDSIVQITTIDGTCLMFLSGKQGDLSAFFKPIVEHSNLMINKVIEMK